MGRDRPERDGARPPQGDVQDAAEHGAAGWLRRQVPQDTRLPAPHTHEHARGRERLRALHHHAVRAHTRVAEHQDAPGHGRDGQGGRGAQGDGEEAVASPVGQEAQPARAAQGGPARHAQQPLPHRRQDLRRPPHARELPLLQAIARQIRRLAAGWFLKYNTSYRSVRVTRPAL